MKKSTLIFLLALSALTTHSWAQEYDDVYFDPSIDERLADSDADNDRWNDNAYDDNGASGYVTEDVGRYSNYGSRIRRFNRPSTSFGYYSGCYVDRHNYYAFQPGTSVFVVNNGWGNSPWGFNDFNRWNAWNNPYGWNNGWGNNWNNPYGWNNGWGNNWNNPYGWNNGWGNNWNNGWGGNNGWVGPIDNNSGRSTSYGPRGGMSSNASGASPRQLARKRRAVAGSDTPQRSLRDANNGRTVDASNGRVSRTSSSINRNAQSDYARSQESARPSRTQPAVRTQPSRSSSSYGRSSSSQSRSSSGYTPSSPSRSSSGVSRSSSSSSRSSGATRSSSSSSRSSSGSSSRSSGGRRGGGR